MKRKKLQEFINYFRNTRREYSQNHSCHCIAAHAKRFLLPMNQRAMHIDASVHDLMRAFDVNADQAGAMYQSRPLSSMIPSEHDRKVALAMLTWLLKTGKVDWGRAYNKVHG